MRTRIQLFSLLCLLLCTLLLANRSSAQNKAAQRTRPSVHILLVGVSDYKHPGDPKSLPDLNCDGDVDALAKVFQEKFAVSRSEIRLLKTKEETTHKAILDAFHHLIEQTHAGDIVFFHFSGKSGLLPAIQKTGQMEQAVVPSDYISTDDHSNDIRFGEIAHELLELKAKHPGSMVVSLDTCHAGGLQAEKQTTVHIASQKALGLGIDGKHGFIIIAASSKGQLAYEVKGDDGKEMGLFCYALAKALASAGSQTTYRDLYEHAAVIMAAKMNSSIQTPEIQGDSDTLVLDTPVLPCEAYLPLQIQDKNSFYLPAGYLQNMSVGSRFALYPRGTKAFRNATPMAEAEVIDVEAATSEVKLLPPYVNKITPRQLMAARAVETQHRYATRIALDLRALAARPKFMSFLNAIRRLPFVREISKPTDRADIRLVPTSNDTLVRVERADGTLLASTVVTKNSLFSVEAALQQEQRWQSLRQLKTPTIKGEHSIRFEMRLVPVTVQADQEAQANGRGAIRSICAPTRYIGTRNQLMDCPLEERKVEIPSATPLHVTGERNLIQGKDGITELAKGDRVMIEVRSLKPGYVNIINLRSDGHLSPVWPHPDLALKDNYLSGDEWQRLPFVLEITEPYGLESLKAIITEVPTDFSYLLNMKPAAITNAGGQRQAQDIPSKRLYSQRCAEAVHEPYWAECAVDYRAVPTTGRLHILAVGAGGKAGDTTGLGLAPADALAIAAGLETRGKTWYSHVFVYPLTGKEVTREAIQKAFEQVTAQARPQDTFVFYYAGAQTLVPRSTGRVPELLLMPQEIKPGESPASQGISAHLLRTLTGRIAAQKQVLLLDVCSSDAPFRDFRNLVTAEDPDLKDLSLRQMVIMGSVGQRILFRGKHGPLAEALLHGINGEASAASGGDNQIMASDLKNYLEGKLLEASEHKLRLNSDQFGEDFPIVPATVTRHAAPNAAMRTVSLANAPIEDTTEYARKGKDYALLIGTNLYDHANELKNPLNDVHAVDETLRELYGFQTTVLLDKTREDILAAIKAFGKRKDFAPDDQLLIFVAGHGSYAEKFGGRIICRNSKNDDDFDDDTVITYDKLRRIVNAIPCQHILLVLDVCYGGSIFETTRSAPKLGSKAEPDITSSELLKMLMGKTSRLALTSGGKEYVPDGVGEHSPFTYRFLQALETMRGKSGILRASTGLLQQVQTAKPQPFLGFWGDNSPGSDFVFIAGPK